MYERWQDEDVEILSVAVDGQGAEVVKPYLEQTTFPTVVDENSVMLNTFGFKKVPNGIFVDTHGTIRLVQEGFDVKESEHLEAVKKLLRGEVDQVELDDASSARKEDALTQQLAQTKYKLGMEYAKQDRKEEALKELDDAILLDPDNFIIRKQRWYIRYPEKFGTEIDFAWQQAQFKREQEQEAAYRRQGLTCGPDGCFVQV
ncbi:thioredoxin family protein [Alkalicoccus chagannorensis]|uniref:thioredoxin family protein n=1 Tax=Alkalicoccus chagannorensis TaxID=427072 RepID=UPI00041B3DF6